MKTYYIAEVQNLGSFSQAEKITAKDLSNAKRKASKSQCFYDTVLQIGTEVNDAGFIMNPIATKVNGKWQDLEF